MWGRCAAEFWSCILSLGKPLLAIEKNCKRSALSRCLDIAHIRGSKFNWFTSHKIESTSCRDCIEWWFAVKFQHLSCWCDQALNLEQPGWLSSLALTLAELIWKRRERAKDKIITHTMFSKPPSQFTIQALYRLTSLFLVFSVQGCEGLILTLFTYQ